MFLDRVCGSRVTIGKPVMHRVGIDVDMMRPVADEMIYLHTAPPLAARTCRVSPSLVAQGVHRDHAPPDRPRVDGFARVPGERQVVGPQASTTSSVSTGRSSSS